MIGYYRKDTRTENERYLEDQLDSMHQEQERQREREEKASKQRQAEREKEWNYEIRHPSDWPAALSNQQVLCRREVYGVDELDAFFSNTAEACERAEALWKEIEDSKQGEVLELLARIEAIKESVRVEVADKLQAASDKREYALVAQQIRNNDLDSFCDW